MVFQQPKSPWKLRQETWDSAELETKERPRCRIDQCAVVWEDIAACIPLLTRTLHHTRQETPPLQRLPLYNRVLAPSISVWWVYSWNSNASWELKFKLTLEDLDWKRGNVCSLQAFFAPHPSRLVVNAASHHLCTSNCLRFSRASSDPKCNS